MAAISSRVVFMTTSPRTPLKMIPEIDLLYSHFNGQPWGHETQVAFMELLREKNFFFGKGANDPGFSARDRITRAPQALGLVTLKPVIGLTPAGKELIASRRKEEVFLRQLLKFQLPSPYHRPTANAANFRVKPYLEIFRLIRHFGVLHFDELMIFGLQLVDYRMFDQIVRKIEAFREKRVKNTGNSKRFVISCLYDELRTIYRDEIGQGRIKIRENKDKSISNFLRVKAHNMRDYADACFRYLRVTGLVNISYRGKSVSIVPERCEEVDYFLQTVEREPYQTDNISEYTVYLGNPACPELLTDSRKYVLDEIAGKFPDLEFDKNVPLGSLRDLLYRGVENRKEAILAEQISAMKNYKLYDDISDMFNSIKQKDAIYDAPLMLEWNTWRAMMMMDGGEIKANLKFDDFGNPMSTAQGNVADIVCDYGDFGVAVEVTMQSGQRQYETEGEPVARHLAKLKKEMNKPAYCLFIAPNINKACIAYFYQLHKINIDYYGGCSVIVPLALNVFEKMVEDSCKASYIPNPGHVRRFFEKSQEIAAKSENETTWYNTMTAYAMSWLNN
ncbi:MAG: AlwI family type II restriction endonuclease [Alistipes sp.]|nr:AlwI family type II restriction endonuclease [Alistipes sp.]